MGTIMDHFPGVPRPPQRSVLEELERSWSSADVFVIIAPTGFGKSHISKTLMSWQGGGITITPTNALTDQYMQQFPELATVRRANSYVCPLMGCPCTKVKERSTLNECRDCAYTSDLARARVRTNQVVCNYYLYLAHKLYRPLVIIDEAHRTVDLALDSAAKKMWHRKYQFPPNLYTYLDVLAWMEQFPELDANLRKLRGALLSPTKKYTIDFSQDYLRGQYQRCMKLIPLDLRNERPILWPRSVHKLVLMSATIGPEDLNTLALQRRRVKYIEADSPIPAANRPIVVKPITNMSYANQAAGAPLIAAELRRLLAKYHTKGIVHCTYAVAKLLQKELDNCPRLMYHSNMDAGMVYRQFLESPESEGKVLIACGFSEGIDLKDGAARWQVIAKVQYPSLADPAIRDKMADNPTWYRWQTVRHILQASGRVCRSSTDFGVTYCLDSSFINLYKQAESLFPNWFKQALVWL